MIVRRFYIGILAILMLMVALPSQAQIDNSTIYFNSEGDLYALDGNTLSNPRQLTTWGYNGGPILSPDGSRLAYTSVASDYLSDVQNYMFPGTSPTNIWVMDTATENFTRIAQQNLTVPTLRGVPSWSPNGSELAWVEYSESTPNVRLIVYDFSNGSATMVAENLNLGFQDGGIYLPRVYWGEAGIARMYFTFVETGQAQQILEIIDPETLAISQFVLYSSSNPFATDEVIPIDFVWVYDNGTANIAILFNDGSWSMLEIATGSQYELTSPPILVSGRGISLIPDYRLDTDGTNKIFWDTLTPDLVIGTTGYRSRTLSHSPALSPDGTTLAINTITGASYVQIDGRVGGGNIVESDETYQSFTRPISVVWAPMRWVTTVDVVNLLPTPSIPNNNGNSGCSTPSNIVVGDVVTVQAGAPNNVRTTPGIDGAFFASLYPGEIVSIVEQSVCADGLRWWRIAGGGGFEGWTAEGSVDGDAWLLVVGSPFANTCPLPPRLMRGDTGVVLDVDDEPNVIRDAPGIANSASIGSIPTGATFDVLGTSLCMEDGRRWFPVRYDGVTGWTAEGEGNTYWLNVQR